MILNITRHILITGNAVNHLAGIDHLIAHYRSFAATREGKDFTINGIEVPATHYSALLASRLRGHCKRKTVFANGIVVPLEELREQSIADAMATSFI